MRVFLVQYLGLHPEDGKLVRREEPEPELVGFEDVDEIVGRTNSDLVSVFTGCVDGVLIERCWCSRYYSLFCWEHHCHCMKLRA